MSAISYPVALFILGISKDTSFKGAWFITPARSFGRLYEMWIPMNEILEAGREDDLDLTEADFGKR